MAWNATCGSFGARLDREVAAAACGSISSPANSGMVDERRRLAVPRGRSGRRRRGRTTTAPKPKVSVSDAGPRPSASPVSSGGASWSSLSVPIELADGHASAPRRVQSCSSSHEIVAVVGDDVEGREQQPVLRRRDDAGLVRAVERHRRVEPLGVAAGGGGTRQRRPYRERRWSRRACPRLLPCRGTLADSPARRAHDPTTCFDTFESGSASESITCESALVSVLGEVGVRARRWSSPSCTAAAPRRRPRTSRRARSRAPRSCFVEDAASPRRTRPRRPARWPRSRRGRCASSAPPRR